MTRIGRPPSCECGECAKCKHRLYMRGWYQRKSLDERREWIGKRDPERVRANDAARYERDKEKRLALNRKWREENRERAREAQRRWCAANRELVRAAKDKWAKANPEKRRAQNQATNAVRDGRLEKKPCEVCGTELRVHAHHPDYSKPLDVRWLCPLHHSQLHARQRRAAA